MKNKRVKQTELGLALCLTVRPPTKCSHGSRPLLSARMNPTEETHAHTATATASLRESTAFICCVAKDLAPLH